MPIPIPIILGVVRIATTVAAKQGAQNQVKKTVTAAAAKAAAKKIAAKKSAAVATKSGVNKTAAGFATGAVIKKGTLKKIGKAATIVTVGAVPKSRVGKILLGGVAIAVLTSANTKSTRKENFSGKSKVLAMGKDNTPSPRPEPNPSEYSWNLPPHTWSLPKLATDVNNPGGGYLPFGKSQVASDTYRRGRLWWSQSADIAIQTGSTEKTGKNYGKKDIGGKGDFEREFGFQFMWNPDAIQTQVAVQMDAVPNVNDMFLSLVAAFPATQSVSFNIRLDRTNDFACAQAKFVRPGLEIDKPNTANRPDSTLDATLFGAVPIRQDTVRDFGQYYLLAGAFQQTSTQLEEKLIDLFERGTLADVEFLYKAINGAGGGGMKWTNRRGIQTADIGYLMPTLLNVDIGPLSYQGYVNSLSITHTSFTPDMVPIRSDLSISLQVLATSGLALSEANELKREKLKNGN